MLVNEVTLSTCSTYVTFQRTTIAESVLSLSRKNVDFKERNHRKATGVAFLGRVSADCIIIVGIFANRNKKKEKKMVDRQKRQQQSLRVETAGAHHSITFVQKKKKKALKRHTKKEQHQHQQQQQTGSTYCVLSSLGCFVEAAVPNTTTRCAEVLSKLLRRRIIEMASGERFAL